MRISAKAEYACVAMLELAASHRAPQPLRIKAIADAHGAALTARTRPRGGLEIEVVFP